MNSHALLLALHLLAVAFWVGGMAVVRLVVRPELARNLAEPPSRLRLADAILGRFLAAAGIAVVVALATGFAMVGISGGFAAQPVRIHAMTGLGIVMTIVYSAVRFGLYRSALEASASAQWPAAGAIHARIAAWVAVNIGLGALTIVAAGWR